METLISTTLSSSKENTPPLQIHHPNVASTAPIGGSKKASPVESRVLGEPESRVNTVVRIRPVNRREREGVRLVHKLSNDALSIEGSTYKFDSVLGPDSSQEDVFNLVGIPLVKNALAGFNTAIFSYGQTGSGKTYTMWGPPSAMLDGRSINSYQGLVPRIFHKLFLEVNRKRESLDEKQIHYQCRCSFLEIYNEQINDLLDPTQRNLEICGDSRNGFHVENLTEEYVTTIEDVTQILVKGLANRRVGATSVNSKSSRSHIVFTCTLESWCKGSSSIFSSSKTSRISLVDLAGIDTDIVDGAGKHFIKEGKFIKQSLSKLGKVISLLAAGPQPTKDQKIPYSDSCLTHLLQDALGGNAKVTFICAISPNDRHKTGTLSTLRFGERARLVQNRATINEITEDDVNGLSDQIRQLKEELIREKSSDPPARNCGAYFKGKNARESLNLLRVSLNRSLILPHIDDNDSSEDLSMDEDLTELCSQLTNLRSSGDEFSMHVNSIPSQEGRNEFPQSLKLQHNGELSVEDTIQGEVHKVKTEVISNGTVEVPDEGCMSVGTGQPNVSPKKSGLTIIPCERISLLQDPPLCTSPKISNLKDSTVMSPGLASKEKVDVSKSDRMRSSLQSSKVNPTESLAASLHRGLQIIDYHQRNSPVKRSLLGLSFDHLANVGSKGQTTPEKEGKAVSLLCSACKKNVQVDESTTQLDAGIDMQMVEVNDARNGEELKTDEIKENGLILANAIKSKLELECLCSEQAATIRQLNCLVDQCKHEHVKSQDANVLQLEDSTSNKCEREALLQEIQDLKSQLKNQSINSSLGTSLLDQIRNGNSSPESIEIAIERERLKWTECESKWISLTEELRLDLESFRRLAEKKELELSLEKKCIAELDDALQRSILGHARIIEHYAELQEDHDDLLGRHRKVMEGIAEVKKAATRAGSKGKGNGKAFAAALAAELSTLRIEREREREYLKKQNQGLRLQLRDTAEAVHAAGEILVRLKEAEEAVSISEEKYDQVQLENEKLRKQLEKMKKKHAMEMVTMKHYLAESRLPESALEPIFNQENNSVADDERRDQSVDDDQSWRVAFSPSYM